jgi:type IV fimbrial biogenesis protein FimT
MKRQKGFSLVEMLTVSVIVAVLLAIGVPSYRYIGNQNRMSMEVNSLLADMQYARSEALREGKNVTVCVSTNGTGCVGSNAQWAKGWLVYSNPAGNAPNNATILRIRASFIGTTPDVFSANNGVANVTFSREGFATTNAAGFNTTRFLLTEKTNSNTFTRCLIVSPVGVLTTQTRTGNPLTC